MYCNQFKNRFKKLEIAGNYEDISKCFMIKSLNKSSPCRPGDALDVPSGTVFEIMGWEEVGGGWAPTASQISKAPPETTSPYLT